MSNAAIKWFPSEEKESLTAQLFAPPSLIWDCYPGGNDTYLIYNSSIERESYAVADKILRARHPHFEQGAFLESALSPDAVIRAQMCTGEFCANAVRATATLIAEDFLKDRTLRDVAQFSAVRRNDGILSFCLEASGTDDLIEVRAWNDGRTWEVEITVPVSLNEISIADACIRIDSKDRLCSIVRMQGVTHVLIDRKELRFLQEPEYLALCLQECRLALGSESGSAIGLIWYEKRGTGWRIDPVVFVNALNSCSYENACGSGTVAFAAAMKDRGNTGDIVVEDPTGFKMAAKFIERAEIPTQLVLRGTVFIRERVHSSPHGFHTVERAGRLRRSAWA